MPDISSALPCVAILRLCEQEEPRSAERKHSLFLYSFKQTASPLSHGSILKEQDQTVHWLTDAADIYQPSASVWPLASKGK